MVNVWIGIVVNYLIGSCVMPHPLSGEIYETFLKEELPEMLEDVPPCIHRRM